MDITKIINFRELSGITSIIDFNYGVLTIDGTKHNVCAVVIGDKLTPAKKAEIMTYKNVVKIGTCNYRHAPEITHDVVYLKI